KRALAATHPFLPSGRAVNSDNMSERFDGVQPCHFKGNFSPETVADNCTKRKLCPSGKTHDVPSGSFDRWPRRLLRRSSMSPQIDQPSCAVRSRLDKAFRNHPKVRTATEDAVQKCDHLAGMHSIHSIESEIDAHFHYLLRFTYAVAADEEEIRCR